MPQYPQLDDSEIQWDDNSRYTKYRRKYPHSLTNTFATLLLGIAIAVAGTVGYFLPQNPDKQVVSFLVHLGNFVTSPTELVPVKPLTPLTTGEPSGNYEQGWRNETNTQTVPANVNLGAPGNFTTAYPDAQNYLNEIWPHETIKIVYTNDPKYNCGIGLTENMNADNIAGGCYRAEYGKVLFLWWGSQISEKERELLLLHEFSHYVQQSEYFDALISAYDASLYDDPVFVKNILEADASCRVVFEWELAQVRDYDNWSAPCNVSNWYEGWLQDQIAARVTITDY